MFWFLTTPPAQINPLLCYCTVIWPTKQFKSTHFQCCVLFSEYHNCSTRYHATVRFSDYNSSNIHCYARNQFSEPHTSSKPPFLWQCTVISPTHQLRSTRFYANVLFSHLHTSSNPPVTMLCTVFWPPTPVQIHMFLCWCTEFWPLHRFTFILCDAMYCFLPPYQLKPTCYYAVYCFLTTTIHIPVTMVINCFLTTTLVQIHLSLR